MTILIPLIYQFSLTISSNHNNIYLCIKSYVLRSKMLLPLLENTICYLNAFNEFCSTPVIFVIYTKKRCDNKGISIVT